MIDERLSVRDWATLHGVSERRVRVWATEGRLEGAEKIGRDWVIPRSAARPEPLPPGRRPK